MFEGIKQLFKKAVVGVNGTKDLFEALGVTTPVGAGMQSAIELWQQMYLGKAPWVKSGIHTLGYPAAVASEIARLVTIEMKVDICGGARAQFLMEQMKPFLVNCRLKTELACAFGDMVFAPYVKENGKIGINYMCPGQHWPLEFGDDGQSTAELFIDRKVKGSREYIRGEIQRFTGNSLEISNRVLARDITPCGVEGNYMPARLEDVEEWRSLPRYATIENVSAPLWGYFKMPLANTVEPGSPLGVSCYSRAVEVMRQADEQWSRLIDEYELGRFRMIVDEVAACEKDRNGRPVFNTRDKLYAPMDAADLFKEWAPALRDDGYINGLNEMLCKIEDLCGLARGTFSTKISGEAITATQVKILNQRTYVTVHDTQVALQAAIERLVSAMDFYAGLYGLAPGGEYELRFEWDDSVIADTEAERKEAMQWVIEGKMAFWRYLVNYCGYTEEEARQVEGEAAL